MGNNLEIKWETKEKFKLGKAFVPIIIYAVVLIAVPILLGLFISSMPLYFALTGISQILALAAIFMYCKKNDIILFEKVPFKWWFLAVVVGVWLINILKMVPLMTLLDTTTTANGEALGAMAEQSILFTFIYGVFVGPILEEIIFRGVMMRNMFAKYPWIGLLVSSLIFCALHTPTDLFSFINYFSMGLLFGGAFMLTKSLKWSIITHIFNNAISLIPMLIMMMMGML